MIACEPFACDGNGSIEERGTDLSDLLSLVERTVDTPGINSASAGHMGYIPGGGIYAAALGDLIAAVTNRYAGVRFASPGAVEMEEAALAWMADLVGFGAGWGGNLTSGGSLANLIGVVTAREGPWPPSPGVRARRRLFHESGSPLHRQSPEGGGHGRRDPPRGGHGYPASDGSGGPGPRRGASGTTWTRPTAGSSPSVKTWRPPSGAWSWPIR